MIQALLLTAWAMSGVACAAMMSFDERRRFGWTPMAIFLGPFWAAVAIEQRLDGDTIVLDDLTEHGPPGRSPDPVGTVARSIR